MGEKQPAWGDWVSSVMVSVSSCWKYILQWINGKQIDKHIDSRPFQMNVFNDRSLGCRSSHIEVDSQ